MKNIKDFKVGTIGEDNYVNEIRTSNYLHKDGFLGAWKGGANGYWDTKEKAEIALDKYLKGSVMKREDLKDGMIVENNAKEKYIVIGERFVKQHGYYNVSGMNRDLTHKDHKSLDIDKVYSATKESTLDGMLNSRGLLLIWERKEQVEELTLEQICKELGRDIKIVK